MLFSKFDSEFKLFCSAFLGVDFIEDVDIHQASGDFAQCDNGRFVVLGVDERVCTHGYLSRATAGDEHEIKAVLDGGQAIFDGHACHGLGPVLIERNGGDTVAKMPSRRHEMGQHAGMAQTLNRQALPCRQHDRLQRSFSGREIVIDDEEVILTEM